MWVRHGAPHWIVSGEARMTRSAVVPTCLMDVHSLQVDVFFSYYPKRLGQVLFVDAPWGFNAGWSVVKPWLKKYAALVSFVSREELRKRYFMPETCPEDFRR